MTDEAEQSIPSRGSRGSEAIERVARDILASGNRWKEIRVAFAIAVASALVMLCGVRLIVWAGSCFE